MERRFLEDLFHSHQNMRTLPSPSSVCKVLNGLLQVLFPELSDRRYATMRELEQHFNDLRLDLNKILRTLEDQLPASPELLEQKFIDQLPIVRERLMMDAQAITKGDPAAVNQTEVLRTYPGFRAIAVYRLAHEFYKLRVPLIPRILTEDAHSKTGIDIHPAAQIGERFCIDHGTGVVIGETVIIGNDVKLYQGVTLGALSVRKEMAQTKRHPTIEDRVIIYSNATILGGETVIGHDSIIGGSVWLTKSVAPYSRWYYQASVRQNVEESEQRTDYLPHERQNVTT